MRLPHISLVSLFLMWNAFLTGQNGAPPASPLPPNAPAIPASVKSSPFSASVVTHYDRLFPNGNHFRRETQGKVFRDSQGRVRTETEFVVPGGPDKLQHITIQDPVQHTVIHLDSRNKTATIHHFGEAALASAAAKDATATKAGNVIMLAPQPGQTDTPATIPLQHPDMAKKSIARSEALGTRTIEGVTASGTRTTRTTENGDGEEITSTSESWFSRDLQMVVLSESDDGQSGHSEMKVINIVRAEPNAQLFQVPPDYTVRDSNAATASAKH